MTYAESILPEFEQEMASTRKVLERIPADKLDWKPHPKSHTIGWNANHVADIISWIGKVLAQPTFDVAPVGGTAFAPLNLSDKQEILETFDRNVAAARDAIAGVKDGEIGETWTLLKAGEPVFSLPRGAMMRTYVLSHLIHHRAILCVSLRLNDIPVPGMYGPSGDE